MNEGQSILDGIELDDTQHNNCIGTVFRCMESTYHYYDRGALVWGTKVVMRQLKKKSCPGCSECGSVLDDLGEFDTIDIRPYIENGALYILDIVDISTDWETEIVDDYGLVFIKVE